MVDISEKIRRYFLSQINDKKIEAGNRLPTEYELSERFGVNRSAIHRAVKKLEESGLVTRHKSRGTFLSEKFRSRDSLKVKCELADTLYVLIGSENPNNIHWSANTLSELERSLNEEGKKVLFKNIGSSRENFKKIISEITENGAISVFVIPADTKFFIENQDIMQRYPGSIFLLSLAHFPPDNFYFNVLTTDPLEEGITAGSYMAEKNFGKIHLILEDEQSKTKYWVHQRIKGIHRGIEKTSKGKISCVELRGQKLNNSIFREACAIIKSDKRKTAFITLTDKTASQFIDYSKTEALLPGKDFAVLSFDDNPELYAYNLNTVAPPREKIGYYLKEMLNRKKDIFKKEAKQTIRLTSTILERNTV